MSRRPAFRLALCLLPPLASASAAERPLFVATQPVNTEASERIHHDVSANVSLGLHWGIFELTDQALDEPPKALAATRRAPAQPAMARCGSGAA